VELLQRYATPYDARLSWVPHAVSTSNQILRSGASETIILSTSPPAATHLAALCLKRRYGFKWVADFQDPLWGNPGRTQTLSQFYDQAMERLVFANADAVNAYTETGAELWRNSDPRH
jgi:hypothetical protein